MASVFTTMNCCFFYNDLIVIVTKKASQARVVTATITMLYLLSIAQLAIQWQVIQSGLVDGETREAISMQLPSTTQDGLNLYRESVLP